MADKERTFNFTTWDAVAALEGDGPGNASSRDTDDHYNRWSEATLDQARHWVRHGWEEGAALMLDVVPVLGEGEVPQFSYALDEEGSEVDIGALMSGQPECMGDMRTVPGQFPLVRIAVDMSVSANVDTSKMLRVGRSVLAVVERLRAAGSPTQVDIVFSITSTGDYESVANVVVRVQDAGQPIHGALLAFWVAHPAALRRAMFALTETLGDEARAKYGFQKSGGYGRPYINHLKAEYDEWALSANNGDSTVDAWVAEVIGRRIGNA